MHGVTTVIVNTGGIEVLWRTVAVPYIRNLFAFQHINGVRVEIGIPDFQMQSCDTIAETACSSVRHDVRIYARRGVVAAVPCIDITGANGIIHFALVLGFLTANGYCSCQGIRTRAVR